MAIYQEFKRKKLEAVERGNIYPNFYNGNLPLGIFCDDQGNEEKCFQAFERVCPQHFLVEEVRFMKFPTAPMCRVRVSYKAENDDLPVEGEALKTLVQLILDESPFNCHIYDRGLIEKNKVVLDYYI